MMHWIELAIAAGVGFCAGVVFIGMFFKSVRNVRLEDQIIRALHEQALRNHDNEHKD